MQDNLIGYDRLVNDDPDIQQRVVTTRIKVAQEMVTVVVEIFFPTLGEVAKDIVPSIQSIEMLKLLTRQIATAENEKLALWVLNSYAA